MTDHTGKLNRYNDHRTYEMLSLKVMGDKILKKIVLYENVFFFTHMIHVNKLFGINRNMTDATDRQKLL